ncbi:aminopeptidase N-like [Sabethes cyaneus]|uniref:aminopeptidase N-like n=1 Tax=Sabethes cyaneus TaxID=53552 RepID=UPI00237D8EDE|nr:aminopeptidase N-like [Sabethes cyaneus]
MLIRLALLCLIASSAALAERFPIEIPPFGDTRAATAAGVTIRQDVDESYRLPTETVPSHYTINLWTEVHDGEPDFHGSVTIDLRVVEPTDTITVHNRGLVVTFAVLNREEEDGLAVVEEPTWSLDEQRELLIFQFTSTLEVGNYELTITYDGRLQTSTSSGFFRKLYRDENNIRRYIASTQFEPTRARMAFPCYDEPSLKATFTVSITHHSSYNAVSNMPLDGEPVPDIENPDFVTTHFQPTQIMSTYLLAFAVTNFETKGTALQEIHARPNAIDHAEFALQVGNDILYAFNVHTDISYYNYKPKIAQIAVPDWGTGAMENWGLVTYGEPVLLFDPTVNTYRTIIDIVTIIGHEYAHQWFGNLVTTDWWQYIWLNEGFATIYGYLGAQLAYPEDNYLSLFQPHNVLPTLRSDSSDSTRPMNWNAATPAEISALFDGVAYGKAGCVLNMFRVVLGEDSWRAGIKKYLLSRALAAATPDDLYTGLQEGLSDELSALPEGSTVKETMESWTTAAGYPVLNVRRNYQNQDVVISQERFYADKVLPGDHVWYIPYNFAHEANGDFELNSFDWLTTRAARLTIDVEPEQWLLFNRQQFGFYRVNYDTRNWRLLTDALIASVGSFHPQNRAQLIDDAFYLARADLLDMSIVLEMMLALRKDHEYLPWAAGNNVLTYLYNKLRGTDSYEPFTLYVNELIEEIYQTLKVVTVDESESLQQKYMKQTISWWACKIGMVDCLSKTKETLQEAVRGNVAVHPDVSSIVYCYGAQSASDEEFLWLYQRMFNSKNPAERTLLIDAMGCSQQDNQLSAYLTSSIGSGVGVEVNYYDSERTRVVQAVYSASRTGVDALIEFLNDWDMADDFIYWLEQPAFNNAIAAIASRTNTPDELSRLKELFDTVQTLAPVEVVEAALATVQANFDWHNTLEGLIVAEFLENFFNGNKI